eukprot:14426677-Alexandrium_andersonii.AAC.1
MCATPGPRASRSSTSSPRTRRASRTAPWRTVRRGISSARTSRPMGTGCSRKRSHVTSSRSMARGPRRAEFRRAGRAVTAAAEAEDGAVLVADKGYLDQSVSS